MSTSACILIVDADGGARLRDVVTAAGATLRSAATAEAATTHLGVVDALVVGPDDLTAALRHAAETNGVEVLLAPSHAPDVPVLERALAEGCAAVVAPGADVATWRRHLATVAERRQRSTTLRDDVRRLRFQTEELRQRCAQQAERMQQNQETYFLDLSRIMTIISNIMDGIVFVDRTGSVTLLNPAAEDLLGAKSFVAIGKPIAALQGRRELLQSLATDHAKMATQKEVSQTIEVHHNEQDLLYIKCITSRVLDYRGQAAGVLTVLRDVTAEFKADQLKNQYLSIVAHELRTPLTGIKTFATMMTKGALGGLTERQQRVCESIREQSIRLEHQIDKLINLGNLESADYGQDREVFPLSEFAAGLLAPFEQPARDRRINLHFEVDPNDESLFADRSDLRRACQALVENALKFVADDGQVAVRIERRDGGLRFRVTDDGIGIDPRYHRRIFEKFFQVEDPLTRHHGGAGLGLFVTKGIVEAHGSSIEVSSQLGRGADFSFALPLHRQPAPAAVAPLAK